MRNNFHTDARRCLTAFGTRFIVALGAMLTYVLGVQAAIEIPVTIINNYPAIPGFDVGFFIDNNIATDYSSIGGGTSTFVDFQLGGGPVGSVLYTDRTSSGGNNGSLASGPSDNVTSFRLSFSNDPTFSTVIWSDEFGSPGYANTDPPSLINNGFGVTAQFARWQVTGASGGNTGGAEIHFFGPDIQAAVPELSSAIVWCVGLCIAGALSCRNRAAK